MQLRKNRLSYASLHGYRYCEVSTTLDFSRPIPWTKVKAMALLLSFADIVVAMEADVIIRNKTVRIESIFDLVEYNVTDKDVIYTTDFQQERDAEIDQKVSINTGVYIMHSTPWTKVSALLDLFATIQSYVSNSSFSTRTRRNIDMFFLLSVGSLSS